MKTLAVLLIALATTAQATVINFHGTISSVGGTPPQMPQVGDSFRGTLVFDPNQPYSDDYGGLNGSLDIYITTVLGIFHTSLEPVYSWPWLPGFPPSITGESMSQRETMGINFLSPDLRTFTAEVAFWDESIGSDLLGVVGASGTATVPEPGSTFALFALSFAGFAMLLWITAQAEKIAAYLTLD
jgi:hypothetical protein